jgi:hypothetical protein
MAWMEGGVYLNPFDTADASDGTRLTPSSAPPPLVSRLEFALVLPASLIGMGGAVSLHE